MGLLRSGEIARKDDPFMSISGIQSNSLLSELSSSSVSSTSSNQNKFQSALNNLFAAIQSGDTTDAKKYLSQVEQLTPSNADSSSPLGQFLSSVSTALENNDISSAQSVLTTLKGQQPPAGPPPPPPSGSDSASSTVSEVAQDVVSLFSSISSGDLTGAQKAFNDLTSLLTGDSSSSSVSTADTTSSSSTGTSSSGETSFASLLNAIGAALNTGDMSSAQTAMSSFLQSLSKGSLVNTTA